MAEFYIAVTIPEAEFRRRDPVDFLAVTAAELVREAARAAATDPAGLALVGTGFRRDAHGPGMHEAGFRFARRDGPGNGLAVAVQALEALISGMYANPIDRVLAAGRVDLGRMLAAVTAP